MQHYARDEAGGWTGCHCEGGIWSTFFSLLLWEALFAPVPDVFRTPFQSSPLDLRTESFYIGRQVGCRVAGHEARERALFPLENNGILKLARPALQRVAHPVIIGNDLM